MTTTRERNVPPDLSTMLGICKERIVLCNPCDDLMSVEEYSERHRKLDDIASNWNESERTHFWYALDELCAVGNPHIRATPGLTMTPENLGWEDSRIKRIAYELMDPESESEGFAVWGFYLYTDPILYSFSAEDVSWYSMAKMASVLGTSPEEYTARTGRPVEAPR